LSAKPNRAIGETYFCKRVNEQLALFVHRYVEGLVTWGVDCAQTDVPGVYARVAKFTNWINNCPNPRNRRDFSKCNRPL